LIASAGLAGMPSTLDAAPAEAIGAPGKFPAGLRPPAPPGIARPGSPELPGGLQGRGLAGPGDMPESPAAGMRPPPPTFPGRGGGGRPVAGSPRPGGPGEMPELPPPGRRMPALPGRNVRKPDRLDEADAVHSPQGESALPGTGRFGTPRSLRGIRDPERLTRPGSVESEEVRLRHLSTLNGRLDPVVEGADHEMESAMRASLPAGLRGRGVSGVSAPEGESIMARPPTGASGDAGRSGVKERAQAADNEAPRIDFVGDTELFAAQRSTPAVIEPPAEPEPVVRADPALRPLRPGLQDRSVT
jgi:hypothetical protein